MDADARLGLAFRATLPTTVSARTKRRE